MVSLKVVAALLVLGLLGCVAVGVYSLDQWTGQIRREYQDVTLDFIVDGDLTVDYGVVVGPTLKNETFVVRNTGNAACTVVAEAVDTGNATSLSWDRTEADIPVGGSESFTLTLLVKDSGVTTVTFKLKL